MRFDEALPRLGAAYDQGVLVPFVGAGMSVDACPGWGDFITGLEKQAGIAPAAEDAAATDLVRRANLAVRVLKRDAQPAFIQAMRASLYRPRKAIPGQTRTLARIWWPLVLTTNYDDHFVTAYEQWHRDPRDRLTVLGRSPQDAQQVLSSLSGTSGCLLWALQGHLRPRASTACTRNWWWATRSTAASPTPPSTFAAPSRKSSAAAPFCSWAPAWRTPARCWP